MEKIKEQYEEMLEDKMKRTQTCKGGEKDWEKKKQKTENPRERMKKSNNQERRQRRLNQAEARGN
jgi:hypothetical protein